MKTKVNTKPVDEMIAKIHALDLDPIKFKLMDDEDGYGWSRDYVDQMEVEYRRFLILVAKYPDVLVPPDLNVDKFWHGHILDTMKYAEDCENIFGYFLHHFPYFGMRGVEDAANLARAGELKQQLYAKEFGTTAASRPAYCAAPTSNPAYCAAQAAMPAYCAASTSSPAYCAAQAAMPAYCAASGSTLNSPISEVANLIGLKQDDLKASVRPTLTAA
jgi:hypothetical protein